MEKITNILAGVLLLGEGGGGGGNEGKGGEIMRGK